MKIYFDTSPDKGPEHKEPLKECRDCGAIAGMRPPPILALSPDDRNITRLATFQHAPTLHIQHFTEEHWLISNPVGQGRIVVLDREAQRIFAAFCVPTRAVTLYDNTTDHTPDDIESIVTLFYKLGLLHAIGMPTRTNARNDLQTLVAWLHITNACNLRCNYCYLQKNEERMQPDISYQAVDAVFRAAQKHNLHKVQLKYAGGEASLVMGQVIALHDYALQCTAQYTIDMEAFILSNGVFLSQYAISAMKERGIGVMLSMDGIGDYHDRQRSFANGRGSFKQIDRTIQKLLERGITPSISVTVSQRNLQGLPQLLDYILAHDLPFSLNYYRENIYSSPIKDLQFGDAQIIQAMQDAFQLIERKLPRYNLLNSLLDKATLQELRQQTCGVGHNYLVIDQHGGIAKCQADIQRTVTSIYDEDPLQAIRDDRKGIMGFSVEEKTGCRDCEWRYWCTGGCPLLTYRATGRYDIKSPNCAIYKALFPAVLRLEALRLLAYQTPFAYEKVSNSYQIS
jgi:uncharacterized protein